MSNANLPAGCTDQDTDGGLIKQPTDEQIHKHVCENWQSLLDDSMFESAKVSDCDDTSTETTYAFITVVVPVAWVDVEA